MTRETEERTVSALRQLCELGHAVLVERDASSPGSPGAARWRVTVDPRGASFVCQGSMLCVALEEALVRFSPNQKTKDRPPREGMG